MTEIKLDPQQLEYLLQNLSKPDYFLLGIGVVFNIFLIYLAAKSSDIFNNLNKRKEELNEQIESIHKSNEALIYISSVLEAVVHHLEGLVLRSFQEENKQSQLIIDALEQKDLDFINPSFRTIRPLECIQEKNFLSKIRNIGKYVQITQVFYRLLSEMHQFQAICDERVFLIKQARLDQGKRENKQIILSKLSEITQRTNFLLISGEMILDAVLFITYELEIVANHFEEELKHKKIKGVKVAKLERNKLHDELRIKLRDIVDKDPNFTNRMLHIKR